MAGSINGIAERCAIHLKRQVIYMRRHPHNALLTCLCMAGNIISIADTVRDSPEITGDITQRHSHDALLTCLIWQVA